MEGKRRSSIGQDSTYLMASLHTHPFESYPPLAILARHYQDQYINWEDGVRIAAELNTLREVPHDGIPDCSSGTLCLGCHRVCDHSHQPAYPCDHANEEVVEAL